MDVARLLIKTKHLIVLAEDIEAIINGIPFNVKIVDYFQDPLRIMLPDYSNFSSDDTASEDSDVQRHDL